MNLLTDMDEGGDKLINTMGYYDKLILAYSRERTRKGEESIYFSPMEVMFIERMDSLPPEAEEMREGDDNEEEEDVKARSLRFSSISSLICCLRTLI